VNSVLIVINTDTLQSVERITFSGQSALFVEKAFIILAVASCDDHCKAQDSMCFCLN